MPRRPAPRRPAVHATARLALHAALAWAARHAAAGWPQGALSAHTGFVERLGATMEAHPTQQSAFLAGNL